MGRKRQQVKVILGQQQLVERVYLETRRRLSAAFLDTLSRNSRVLYTLGYIQIIPHLRETQAQFFAMFRQLPVPQAQREGTVSDPKSTVL